LTCWLGGESSWTSRTRVKLRGKLRELRFHLGRDQQRISYYLASGRRIPMLTVFRKTKRREQAEIDRAEAAMRAHMERDRRRR